MSLADSLAAILELDIPAAFDRFGEKLDAEWINDALEETGTASVRRRKLSPCVRIAVAFSERILESVGARRQ